MSACSHKYMEMMDTDRRWCWQRGWQCVEDLDDTARILGNAMRRLGRCSAKFGSKGTAGERGVAGFGADWRSWGEQVAGVRRARQARRFPLTPNGGADIIRPLFTRRKFFCFANSIDRCCARYARYARKARMRRTARAVDRGVWREKRVARKRMLRRCALWLCAGMSGVVCECGERAATFAGAE